MELLAGIRGSCSALARLMRDARGAVDQGCSPSFGERLRRYIETTTPVREQEEEDSKRRGLAMLNQLGGR